MYLPKTIFLLEPMQEEKLEVIGPTFQKYSCFALEPE